MNKSVSRSEYPGPRTVIMQSTASLLRTPDFARRLLLGFIQEGRFQVLVNVTKNIYTQLFHYQSIYLFSVVSYYLVNARCLFHSQRFSLGTELVKYGGRQIRIQSEIYSSFNMYRSLHSNSFIMSGVDS